MARSRMIKPEFWDDEKLAIQASVEARLTYIGTWNFSDDYGVVKANPRWLRSRIWPFDDKLSLEIFTGWLKELEDLDRLIPFEAENELFYWNPKFLEHQTINKPAKWRNPEPPQEVIEHYYSSHVVLPYQSRSTTVSNQNQSQSQSKEEVNKDHAPKKPARTAPQKKDFNLISEALKRCSGKEPNPKLVNKILYAAKGKLDPVHLIEYVYDPKNGVQNPMAYISAALATPANYTESIKPWASFLDRMTGPEELSDIFKRVGAQL